MTGAALTVTQLNAYVKSIVESDGKLKDLLIRGEISSFHRHFRTGHLFFSLKDAGASIKVVMFQSYANRLAFSPEDGMSVIVRGTVSVFERDGVYQLYAKDILPEGVGARQLALEQLKRKLAAEGLFDAGRKKPLPPFPQHIALITSKSGAAVKDVLGVLARRYNLCTVSLIPVSVQGEAACPSIVRALRYVSIAGRYDACILTRGGGSQEDLWVFNREEIARAIADCPVPVISAVGHEIDFTVADLAADLRAPTPSAAAELVAPDSGEIARQLNGASLRMETALHRLYTRKKEALYQLQLRHRACSPAQLLGERGEGLAALRHRLQAACAKQLDKLEADWRSAADLCESLNPAKVLSRGYAIAQKDGAAVHSIMQIQPGDRLSLRFCDGEADCTVDQIGEEPSHADQQESEF